MVVHNGAHAEPGVSGTVAAKTGVSSPVFKMSAVLYGSESAVRLTRNSVNVEAGATSTTDKQGILQPVFAIANRSHLPHNAPDYVVGPGGGSETIIEEVIVEVEVEKVYQPRKEPLEWFPEVWNGQKPKEPI